MWEVFFNSVARIGLKSCRKIKTVIQLHTELVTTKGCTYTFIERLSRMKSSVSNFLAHVNVNRYQKNPCQVLKGFRILSPCRTCTVDFPHRKPPSQFEQLSCSQLQRVESVDDAFDREVLILSFSRRWKRCCGGMPPTMLSVQSRTSSTSIRYLSSIVACRWFLFESWSLFFCSFYGLPTATVLLARGPTSSHFNRLMENRKVNLSRFDFLG